MKWRVEKSIVRRKIWGPEDDYEVAFGDKQVFGYKPGDTIYRIVSDPVTDPTDLYLFIDAMNEFIEVVNENG